MEEQKGLSMNWVVTLFVLLIATFFGAFYLGTVYSNKSESNKVEVKTSGTQTAESTTTTPSASTTTNGELDVKKQVCEQIKPNLVYGENSGEKGNLFCQINKIDGNFAEGISGEIQGFGSHFIAVKENNIWKQVQDTQNSYDCNLLIQYNFPKGFVEKCVNYSTGETVDY